MIPHHFKQGTTTYRKNWSRHQAHRWWRRRSALSMVIPEKYIFFIWKKAWMTRKISVELWKVVVFKLITTYTFSLSSWVIYEWFTQKLFPCDNRSLSPFFGLKNRFLSFWVGGLPYKYIHSVSLILIRGYSKTQKRPFYSIYIYIYYIYILDT